MAKMPLLDNYYYIAPGATYNDEVVFITIACY